jgi:hypothetical protein
MVDVVAMEITSEPGRNVSTNACQKVLHDYCMENGHPRSISHTDCCSAWVWYDVEFTNLHIS